MAGTAKDSKASTSYIPDVSYSSRISDSLTYGIAVAGIAGMGSTIRALLSRIFTQNLPEYSAGGATMPITTKIMA